MSNPFIPLTKSALKLDMSKNETRLFLVLTMQTLGYHKGTDNLTDKRLSQLTGIRLDHLRPCLERFLDYGLFERIEHKHYDYQYRLCDEFLDDSSNAIFPPTLPRNRAVDAPCSVSVPQHGAENAPRSVDFPNDGGHTTENPNIKKPPQHKTQTEKNDFQKKQQHKTKTEKTISQAQPQPSVTISMSGLTSLPDKFVIESTQPIRLEFSAKDVGQVTAIATDTKREKEKEKEIETQHEPITTPITESVVVPITPIVQPVPVIEPVAKPITPPIAEPVEPVEPSVKPCVKTPINANSKPIADLVASVATSLMQSSDNAPSETTEKPFVVVNKEEKKQPQPSKSKQVIKLPKAVGEENTNACNRYFQPLSEQLQRDVITVFFYKLKTSKINSKAGYFIGLCQKAAANGLTVPSAAIVKKPVTPEQQVLNKKANEAREKRESLWADYQWIKRQAATQNKSEQEVAEMMGLEKGYALFGQPEEACAA